MQELTASKWQRIGSSIVWAPDLLAPLMLAGDALPLRTVLSWYHQGFPDSPPKTRVPGTFPHTKSSPRKDHSTP
jgi:hypothetical protein